MRKLPHWVLTDKFPAFYDCESLSAIEQTARIYGAMQELIEEYNKFVDGVNEEIEKFFSDAGTNSKVFERALTQKFDDFINVVDLKISGQDKTIKNTINQIKENLAATITDLLKELVETGELSDLILESFENIGTNLNAHIEEANTKIAELENLLKSLEDLPKDLTEHLTQSNARMTSLEDNKTSLGKIIQGIRAKVLSLSSGIRNIHLDMNEKARHTSCRVSAATDDYINIGCNGGELNRGIRLWIGADEVKSYEITMLSGSAISRTSLYSGTTAGKIIKHLAIDSENYFEEELAANPNILKDALFEGREFRQLTLTYLNGDIAVTLVITSEGFNVTESSTTAELSKTLISGSYVKDVIVHGNTAKQFKMGAAGKVPYFEKVSSFENVVVKEVKFEGGF